MWKKAASGVLASLAAALLDAFLRILRVILIPRGA